MEVVEIALREELDGLVSTFLSLPIARGFHLVMVEKALHEEREFEAILVPPENGQEEVFRTTLRYAVDELKAERSVSSDDAVETMRSMKLRRSFYEGHIRDNNLNGRFPDLEEPLRRVANARAELYRYYDGLSAEFPDIDPNVVLEASWRASLRYDPSLGYGFPTYAQHWITVFEQRYATTEAQQD